MRAVPGPVLGWEPGRLACKSMLILLKVRKYHKTGIEMQNKTHCGYVCGYQCEALVWKAACEGETIDGGWVSREAITARDWDEKNSRAL